VSRVEQITFNGTYAAETGQPVLYVTERAVLRLTREGLELIEIAPGIDVERDILARMGFAPIVRDPKPMDARLFRSEPMGLEAMLIGLSLADRISYDPERNTLFLNFEGLHVRTREDVDRIRAAVEQRCLALGRKVAVVVNYDSFRLDQAVIDYYADMVRYLEVNYYTTVSRYTTSAFMRLKLGAALAQRSVAPHIFETELEARTFLRQTAAA
jgi:propionate CoA-transferase